jgi:hypothetical protein
MKIRVYLRETYDEIISLLISSRTDRDPISEGTLEAIDEGLSDIRDRKTQELNQFCDAHGI